jgi:hypothetical protein
MKKSSGPKRSPEQRAFVKLNRRMDLAQLWDADSWRSSDSEDGEQLRTR